MPGERSINKGNYRFGFNGKEDDRDWGMQNIQDYGFRLYNPSIAKFLSVDPLTRGYPMLTPYQFASNTPIGAIDLDGLEAQRKFAIQDAMKKASKPGLTTTESKKVFKEAMQAETFLGNVPISKENMHTMLDGLGMVPVYGEVFDGINALAYVIEGDYTNAGISAVAIIPIIGEGGKVGKYVAKYGDEFYEITGDALRNKDKILDGAKSLSKKDANAIVKKGKVDCPTKCFLAGTLILTSEGSKEIQNIEIGDLVWSYNEDTGGSELKEVIYTHKLTRDSIYHIHLNNGETISATPDHPFFVHGMWYKVEDLSLGDSLVAYDIDVLLVIDSLVLIEKEVAVYNFTVADNHTYYVGQGQILVHNCPWFKNPYLKHSKEKLLEEKEKFTKMIKSHEEKYEEFMKDPVGNSSPKWLKTATKDNPSSEELLKRAKGRGGALKGQIKKQKGELKKIETALKKKE